jgi:hypothetical protein
VDRKKTLFAIKFDVNLRNKVVKSYIWSVAFYVLKLADFGKLVRNIWKILKCGVGGGWRRSFGPIL